MSTTPTSEPPDEAVMHAALDRCDELVRRIHAALDRLLDQRAAAE